MNRILVAAGIAVAFNFGWVFRARASEDRLSRWCRAVLVDPGEGEKFFDRIFSKRPKILREILDLRILDDPSVLRRIAENQEAGFGIRLGPGKYFWILGLDQGHVILEVEGTEYRIPLSGASLALIHRESSSGGLTAQAPAVGGPYRANVDASGSEAIFLALKIKRDLPDSVWNRRDPRSFEFVEVPAGVFWMGSPAEEWGHQKDEVPHRVHVTKNIEVGLVPFTELEIYLLTGSNPSADSDTQIKVGGVRVAPNFPARNLSPLMADRVVQMMNRVQSRHEYFLPSEAMWERMASGALNDANLPKPAAWSVPREALPRYAHFGRAGPVAVGTLAPNPLGVLDVLGNVYEVTSTWAFDYPDDPNVVTVDPNEAGGKMRIIRGGSYRSKDHCCRPAYRAYIKATRQDPDVGLRLARVRR